MIKDLPVLANGTAQSMTSTLSCLVHVARFHGLHLTAEQVVRDNHLAGEAVTLSDLAAFGRKAGLKAREATLSWNELEDAADLLPAVIELRDGTTAVLQAVKADKIPNQVQIIDCDDASGAQLLVIDRVRLEEAWSGKILLLRRDYDIRDEEQPFSFGLVTALLFREKKIVRDLALAAIVLSVLALSPIMFWRILTDKVLSYRAFNTFYVLCSVMAVLIAFDTMFGFVRRELIQVLTARVDVRLATYMFEKVLHLPMDFFERTPVGLIARDMNEIWRIRTFLTGQVFGTVLDSVLLFIFIPIMFVFNWQLTTIVLALCALMGAWIILMLPFYRRRSMAVQAAEGERGSFLVQTLHGMRTVKSLSLGARQMHHWDVFVARIAKLRLAEGRAGNLIQTVINPIEKLMISGTFALGVYLAMSTTDGMAVGTLFAFLLLAQRVAAPLLQMAQLVQQFDEARSAVAVVGHLVNMPAEEGRGANGVKNTLSGEVEFSGVRFSYPGAVSPALRDVTLAIPAGTRLGIMGRSGSGKTTVTRLLQRLHSDYQGLIKVDGVDVREYDVDHLRRSLGVVLQDNYLFSGTIRENIAIAKRDATLEEVVRAARLAGAEEFIERLPRGFETYIFEGSSNLSGGQRQRLAIARALITDPKILLLDEATSALDPESEAIVNANIERIARGRTVLMISHRLSSLVQCDKILVLEKGAVADLGTHAELLSRCEIYASLWNEQNGHITQAPGKRAVRGPHLVQ